MEVEDGNRAVLPWDLSGQRHQDGDVRLLRPAVPAAAPLEWPCDRSRRRGPEKALLGGPSAQSAPLTVSAARHSGSALPGTAPPAPPLPGLKSHEAKYPWKVLTVTRGLIEVLCVHLKE